MSIAGSLKKGAGALERALAKEGTGGRLSKAESRQLRIFKQDSAHEAKVAAKQSIIDAESAKKVRFDHDTEHLANSSKRHEMRMAKRGPAQGKMDSKFKELSAKEAAGQDDYSRARVFEERSSETFEQRKARIGARGKTSQEFVDNQRGRAAEGYSSAVDDKKFESTIAGGIGMDPKEYEKLSRDERLKNINTWGNTQGSVSMMDSLRFHRAPEAALGLGVTGAAVLGLSGSRGRQTNSQLYSQT